MRMNKNGIPIDIRKANKRMKQQKRQHELRKLDFHEFAEFRGYEQGCEITIVVPAFEPLVQAIKEEGWKYIGNTKGEIA